MKKNILLYLLASLVITSCSLIGINLKHKAPRIESKIPKFHQQDSLLGYLSKDRDCYQPYYYDLDISFDLANKSIQGKTDIYFLAKENLQSILLNLNEALSINEIKWNGQLLKHRRKHTGLWIDFPTSIHAGEKTILSITYHGKPPIAKRPPWEGGFVWKKDSKKRPWLGVACEQLGANLWWPLKDHLTAEPDSMKMSFSVPKGLTCVSNGKLIKQEDTNGISKFTYRVTYPINTYNVTFYIGNFEHFSISYNKEEKKRLHFYVLDYNLEKAQKQFVQTKKVVQTFENIYGEYPFWRDDFKLVESPYEGMEHQTAIAYGHGYRNNSMGMDYIILHETAHEWWGNAISVKDYADIWLHEGMATYSEALFFEEMYGHDTYLNYMHYYAMMVKNKKPMEGPRNVNYWNYKDSDPYTKGAAMIHSLRSTMDNDSLFFNILRSFYSTYKYQTVCAQDFIHMVNEKTGSDYSWFFKKFLKERKPAKLEYSIQKNEKENTQIVWYKWTDVAPDFKMPAQLQLADGSYRTIYPGTELKSITIEGLQSIKPDMRFNYFTYKKVKHK